MKITLKTVKGQQIPFEVEPTMTVNYTSNNFGLDPTTEAES